VHGEEVVLPDAIQHLRGFLKLRLALVLRVAQEATLSLGTGSRMVTCVPEWSAEAE
jgi:hypothetical protein